MVRPLPRQYYLLNWIIVSSGRAKYLASILNRWRSPRERLIETENEGDEDEDRFDREVANAWTDEKGSQEWGQGMGGEFLRERISQAQKLDFTE